MGNNEGINVEEVKKEIKLIEDIVVHNSNNTKGLFFSHIQDVANWHIGNIRRECVKLDSVHWKCRNLMDEIEQSKQLSKEGQNG